MAAYGAITIGPIIETLSQASGPGALWCASGMFSRLAGDLCESILTSIPDAEIIAPAYTKGYKCTDGIGRWHDRVFFSCSLSEDELGSVLASLCAGAKAQLAKNICRAIGHKEGSAAEIEFINDYIQLSWLTAPEEMAHAGGSNCILNLSKYLDSLELTADFPPDESASPITRLFTGTSESANAYIRHCWLMPENGGIQLLKSDGSIRSIEDVANPQGFSDGLKKRRYFAVVQSDGDNMGTALRQNPTDKEVRSFSELCIQYAGEAAEAVGKFGGLTVYAGGDDLLFLAPLEGKDGSSILTLCEKITEIFNMKFSIYKTSCATPPSLSFGISVNYYKSPLYEALEDARTLLFSDAKDSGKNHIALSVHKHSGQSLKLLLPNSMEGRSPTKKLGDLIARHVAGEDDLLHSILYTIDTFRSSFALCREKSLDTRHLYHNLFDSIAHNEARRYIDTVKELGDAITEDGRCRASGKSGELSGDDVDVLCGMLRFAKLYTERGDQ